MHSINNHKFKHLVGFLKNKFINSNLASLDRIQKNATFALRDHDDNNINFSLLSLFKSIEEVSIKDKVQVSQKREKIRTDTRNNDKKKILIIQDKPVSILSLNKILSKNDNFTTFTHKINPRYDNYSLAFFKTIDSSFRNSNDYIFNTDYLKKMKVSIIDIFNKQEFYKKFSYSSKDFKKSDLDNCFTMNMSINKNMLKVYCNVFRINLVYKTLESSFKFMTRFDKNNATFIIIEDNNALHTLYNKSNTFIRGSELSDILGVDKNWSEGQLIKMKLDELQNIAKMKNKDVKKQGKTSKINKTKEELIKEITS